MIEMHMALRALRQIALASTQSELDVARMEATDVLDQAGWENSARTVIDNIGLTVTADREGPSQQG
ncbi:MAG: hypothetical protein AB7D33_07760 [Sphingobium sp.]